jgi:hypothetical protein
MTYNYMIHTTFKKIYICLTLLVISLTINSQNFKLVNQDLYGELDTVPNIIHKRLIYKKYFNGNIKEIGIQVKRIKEDRTYHDYVGFHLRYFRNGSLKDSSYFDIYSNSQGIAKGYYKEGNLKWIGLSRDISIADGMNYSKNRTGLSDIYEIHYYKNGNIELEYGANMVNKNFLVGGYMAICSISYKKDGSIKRSVIIDP